MQVDPTSFKINLVDLKAVAAGRTSGHFNVAENVEKKLGMNLHLQPGHPLHTIKHFLEDHFVNTWGKERGHLVASFDNLSPVISTTKSFDELLFPANHPGRMPSDTYYIDSQTVLRPHTSAHQNEILKAGSYSFLCSGDVYRRDEIDATHFPVFHQMEMLHLVPESQLTDPATATDVVVADMKEALEGMVKRLFGDVEIKWSPDNFPFTDPSFELEVFFQGKWLEVLGCGSVHPQLLKNIGLGHRKGWAFGLGLERLAMILFNIPDIRLFWSQDPRFHEQFKPHTITKFQPYSKYPSCFKDVAFWVPQDFTLNAFFDMVRDVCGDLVEDVKVIDEFTHPKTQRKSYCFRINYRSMDRNLTNEEIDVLQFKLREKLPSIGVELR